MRVPGAQKIERQRHFHTLKNEHTSLNLEEELREQNNRTLGTHAHAHIFLEVSLMFLDISMQEATHLAYI